VKLTVYHDGQFVKGMRLKYQLPNGTFASSGHQGRLKDIKDPRCQKVRIRLNPGEFISELAPKGGDLLDCLIIRTSTGQFFQAGGPGGNPQPNLIPPGKRLAGFHGHHGGCIHKIGVYFR